VSRARAASDRMRPGAMNSPIDADLAWRHDNGPDSRLLVENTKKIQKIDGASSRGLEHLRTGLVPHMPTAKAVGDMPPALAVGDMPPALAVGGVVQIRNQIRQRSRGMRGLESPTHILR